MKKKIASLFMAIAVFVSLCVSAMALEPVKIQPSGVQRFTDVPTTHWAFAYVDKVASAGLFNGLTPTTFGPSNNMSRGQFVMVLARMEGQGALESVPTDAGFSDVPRDHRFAGPIAWAKDKGIVGGYTDGTFRPGQPISRAQFAAMIHRYIDYKQYDQKNANGTYKTAANGNVLKIKELTTVPAQFPDYNLVADVFKADVDYARLRGLVQGFGDGTLRPNIAINRGQIAAILARFMDLLVSSGYAPFLDGTDQRNTIYTPKSSGRGGGSGSSGTPPTYYSVSLTVTDTDAMGDGAAYGGTVTMSGTTYTASGAVVGTQNTTAASGTVTPLQQATAGSPVTFTVEPNTASANPFGIVGGAPTVQTASGAAVAVTKNGTSYSFTMPAGNVAITVGFNNASIRASLNGASVAAIYNADGSLLTTAPTSGTEYTVRINALQEGGETSPGVYDNGASLKSFKVLVNGAENNSYLTSEEQSLGLYKNAYHDGVYKFTWNGEVVDFAVETTTYTYDVEVMVDLDNTNITSSPTLTLEGQSADRTFSALMPELNDSAENAQNLTMTIQSAVGLLNDEISITMNDEAMLKRVMKETIEGKVEGAKFEFRTSMMNAMAAKAGGWKGAVEKTIWNSTEVQSNDFVKLLKANGYLPAADDTAGTYPIHISDADAAAVQISVDSTMIDNVVNKVMDKVNEQMNDLVIGAVLKNADPEETGYDAGDLETNFTERYLQIVGQAQKKTGPNTLTLGSFDANTTVKVSLTGQNPTYYIQLNAAGQGNALAGGVLKITKTADATLPVIPNDPSADALIAAYEANMPAFIRFNKTEWSWTLLPAQFPTPLTYSTADGYRLGTLDLSLLTQEVNVGAYQLPTINLSEVEAPVPISNLGGRSALDRRVNGYRNSFKANGEAQKATDALYDATENDGYAIVTELLDSDGKPVRIDSVTLGGTVFVNVLPALDANGNPTEETGKETILHLVTNPANWAGTTGTYLDNLITRADAIRQGISKDNASNPASAFYTRLGRGTFTGGFTSAWRTNFDKSNLLSTRGAYATAAGKIDSTPADLWRALGLSETKASDTMTYQIPKKGWDPSGGKKSMYFDILEDVLGSTDVQVKLTVTRHEG